MKIIYANLNLFPISIRFSFLPQLWSSFVALLLPGLAISLYHYFLFYRSLSSEFDIRLLSFLFFLLFFFPFYFILLQLKETWIFRCHRDFHQKVVDDTYRYRYT